MDIKEMSSSFPPHKYEMQSSGEGSWPLTHPVSQQDRSGGMQLLGLDSSVYFIGCVN